MPDFTMTIDGGAVAGEASFGVINPATGKVFAWAPDCRREELDVAMEAAARAFPAWRSDEGRRRGALRACSEVDGHARPGRDVLRIGDLDESSHVASLARQPS